MHFNVDSWGSGRVQITSLSKQWERGKGELSSLSKIVGGGVGDGGITLSDQKGVSEYEGNYLI